MNKKLVACAETPFPDRCVKCNAPANGFRLKRVLYQPRPGIYIGLAGLLYMAYFQKKLKLHIGLCPKHRAQRWRAIIIGWGGALGGLVLMVIGAVVFDFGWPVLVGFIIFSGCAIYGGVKGLVISATAMNKEYALVKGVHRDFLAELPEWPHSR